MCQSIFFTTCLPKPNSILTTHIAAKLGRQGCGRKTKARRPNDRVDHNNLNHNNTSGNSLYDIQEMSICILFTKGMHPLYPFSTILRGTARTDIFVEVVNLASAEAMWGAFRICHSTPIAIKDHRLSLRLRHAHYKTLLLQTAADRLAEYSSVRFGS